MSGEELELFMKHVYTYKGKVCKNLWFSVCRIRNCTFSVTGMSYVSAEDSVEDYKREAMSYLKSGRQRLLRNLSHNENC